MRAFGARSISKSRSAPPHGCICVVREVCRRSNALATPEAGFVLFVLFVVLKLHAHLSLPLRAGADPG
jgi:hypothetical protein